MVDASSRAHPKNSANSYISELNMRISNDESYESVKPWSFTTIQTSRTSCRRNQVKSTNHGKTHIFQY